jgi:transcriptional regulator with XRE-family HTH domain
MESPLMKADALESAAPFLFAEAEIGAEKLEATGEFSGERLLARRPEVYRAICRMSAEGLSMSAMARALGVSRNTVAAVQEREGISIEQHKKELLRNVRTAARLSVERVVELVPTINNAKDAAIVAAVMVDKLQLLSGEATSRVEKVEVSQDKLSEMLASLPLLEAEVVPVTGPSGSGSTQKGLLGVGAGSVSGCLAGLVSDTESEGLYYADGRRDTTLDTTCAVEPVEVEAVAVDQEGGEGVGFSDTPPLHSTDLGEQKILCKGASVSQEAAEELSTN